MEHSFRCGYFTAPSSGKGSRLHVQIYLHEQPKRGIHSCFSVYDGNSSSGKILCFTQANGYTDEINERRCKKSCRWFVVV